MGDFIGGGGGVFSTGTGVGDFGLGVGSFGGGGVGDFDTSTVLLTSRDGLRGGSSSEDSEEESSILVAEDRMIAVLINNLNLPCFVGVTGAILRPPAKSKESFHGSRNLISQLKTFYYYFPKLNNRIGPPPALFVRCVLRMRGPMRLSIHTKSRLG